MVIMCCPYYSSRQAELADDPADRRDAVILVARAQARYAVLFRVHAHGAEFHDPEFFSVPGQTRLPVKRRAAVIEMDRQAGDQQTGLRMIRPKPEETMSNTRFTNAYSGFGTTQSCSCVQNITVIAAKKPHHL